MFISKQSEFYLRNIDLDSYHAFQISHLRANYKCNISLSIQTYLV